MIVRENLFVLLLNFFGIVVQVKQVIDKHSKVNILLQVSRLVEMAKIMQSSV